MSQEKIDAYKKEKSGRKERIAKHKLHVKIAKITSLVVVIALIAAIAGSIVWNKVGASSEAADSASSEVSTEVVVDGDATEAVSADVAAEEVSVEAA